ncbi:MAG: hypothetical protein ACTSRS_08955 [Candidatus Helarchaeota archaeon]
MRCELCHKREAITRMKFKKRIASHMGAKVEAILNVCEGCKEKIRAKAIKFSMISHLDQFFKDKENHYKERKG